MPHFDITTLGEGQLRYSVPAGKRLAEAQQLDVHVTGTELNVACLLSRLGWSAGWVSGLPDTPLGQRVLAALQLAGVDVTAIKHTPEARLATYYVEFAHQPRSSQVYYDRANTAFTNLTPDDIDWDYLMNTRLLHISGLTLPLSASIQEILSTAVAAAQAHKVPVSFDMNYRRRLWTPTAAAEVVRPFVEASDLLFFPGRDARALFNFQGSDEAVLTQLGEISNARYLILSRGAQGLLGWDRRQFFAEPARETVILDRIGAGDAMVAGVLHGYLQDDFVRGLRYGALTAALTLSYYGDQFVVSAPELEKMLDEAGGDIVR
jgi:2-dehydro-3-deoxygluconokinase